MMLNFLINFSKIFIYFKNYLTARPWAERGSCFTRCFFQPRGHGPSAVHVLPVVFFFFSVVLSVTRRKLLSVRLRMTQRMVFILKGIMHVSISPLQPLQKAIYLFQKTSYSPCGTFLFRTKQIFALNACAE